MLVGREPLLRGAAVTATEWVPGLSWPAQPGLPSTALPAPMHGFPRAAGPVREWVPGVSTPDGLLLGAAAVAGMAVAHPALVERLVAGAVTSSMVLVGTVLPGGAGWFGINLGQPG